MSVYAGPEIVSDGLVLCLDAANRKSYPGSGTTWFDLSGSNNNGTIANGPTFSSSNGGIFQFDGIDDNVIIPINLSSIPHTVIAIARYTGVTSNRIITSNNGNWLMGWWGGQTNKYYAESWVSSSSGDTAETSWLSFAATGNTTTDQWSLYRNGKIIVQPNTNGAGGPNGLKIGGWTSSEFSTCQASVLMAYNRVLTAAEIQQNFNAFRGRFGI